MTIGTYDNIHLGTHCCQTKALGRGVRDLGIGDRGQVISAPLDEAAQAVWLEKGDEPVADSGNVLTSGGWLVLVDGILIEWGAEGRLDLPFFDYFGHAISDGNSLTMPFTMDEVADARASARSCDYCAATRSGRFIEFRAEQQALAMEHRALIRRARLRVV